MTPLVQVTLPWPSADLNPNNSAGRFWGVKQKAKKSAREYAQFLAAPLAGNLPPAGDLAAVISLQPPDRRRRDIDNVLAALKPSLDGLALALGYDDSRVRAYHIHMDAPCLGGAVHIALHPGGRS